MTAKVIVRQVRRRLAVALGRQHALRRQTRQLRDRARRPIRGGRIPRSRLDEFDPDPASGHLLRDLIPDLIDVAPQPPGERRHADQADARDHVFSRRARADVARAARHPRQGVAQIVHAR
jgi:hypothetical protein